MIRRVDYLNWRFVDTPKAYRVLASPRGWAVVGHSVYHGVSSGYVADLVVAPGQPRDAHGLLRRALRQVDADVVIAIPPPGLTGAFAAAGFVPSHLTIRVIGKELAPGAWLPDRWHFALGDTDYF